MRPNNFKDLLILQEKLDEAVSEERENGFIPRERDFIDIYLSFDDEVNEWAKELPYEYNFKTWKEKEYSRENELEEFVDTLFFTLQYVNHSYGVYADTLDVDNNIWTEYRDKRKRKKTLKEEILIYKANFKSGYIGDIFNSFWKIAELRNFTENEILEAYYKKWKKNMKRIKGDWSL